MRLTKKEMRAMQLLLLVLIGEGVVIGLQALFVPSYFYHRFLLGAAWMPMLGAYSAEMTRTAGALYLGLSVPAIIALIRPSARLLQAVGVANVVAAFPHMIYHLVMAHVSGYFPTIPQAGSLFLTILVGLAVFDLARVGQRRYFLERRAALDPGFVISPDSTQIARSRAGRVRTLLGLLLIEYLVIGVQTLFFPDSFYQHFFIHADWVSELGAYSQHLTIDTGALTFGLAAVVIMALARPTTELVRALGWAVAVAALPQVVYHLAELPRSGALATAVQAGTLFVTMLIGLALAVMSRSPRQQATLAEPAPFTTPAVSAHPVQ